MKQKAPTNYAKTMCSVQCHDEHRGNQQQINQCYNECIQRHSSEVFKPNSQISEKLADSDLKHGFPPSFPPILEPFHSQEPTMADEIYNQDLMYI